VITNLENIFYSVWFNYVVFFCSKPKVTIKLTMVLLHGLTGFCYKPIETSKLTMVLQQHLQ